MDQGRNKRWSRGLIRGCNKRLRNFFLGGDDKRVKQVMEKGMEIGWSMGMYQGTKQWWMNGWIMGWSKRWIKGCNKGRSKGREIRVNKG